MSNWCTTGAAAESIAPEFGAEMAQWFADGWRVGATDAARFFEHFSARFAPDAVLIQPLSPVLRGPAGLRKLFEPVFQLMPDLRGELVRWGATQDGLFIELALRGTFDGRTVEWTTVDRLVVRANLIVARRSYFDSLPLLVALLSRPFAVVKLLPLLLGGSRVRATTTLLAHPTGVQQFEAVTRRSHRAAHTRE